MDRNDFTIKGLDELIISFNKLAQADKNAFVIAGAKDAAELILNKAKQLVPVETGDLRDSIEIKPVRAKSGQGEKAVFTDTIYTVGTQYVSYGRKGGVNYGHLVELGHGLVYMGKKTNTWVKAKPFLRPAADTSQNQVYKILGDALIKAIDKSMGD